MTVIGNCVTPMTLMEPIGWWQFTDWNAKKRVSIERPAAVQHGPVDGSDLWPPEELFTAVNSTESAPHREQMFDFVE